MGVASSAFATHEHKLGVVIAVNHATGDLAEPDLGAAKILQDRDLGLGLRGDPTDQLEVSRMALRGIHARN